MKITEALLAEHRIFSRAHFATEEQRVFPLLESTLQQETLIELGGAWMKRLANLREPALSL